MIKSRFEAAFVLQAHGNELKCKNSHPERFTELHEEEKMEDGDRGDQEEKRGNQKDREQSSQ